MSRASRDIGGMHSSVLRRINSIQVFNALRLQPTISQREIGRVTGIDRTTVSTIVAHFDGLGLLTRSFEDSPGRRGRPSESLSLRPEAGLLVGVHVVPERVLYVASGLDGKPFATLETAAIADPAKVADELVAGLEGFCAQIGRTRAEISAIGVCVPGLISNQGMLAESSNLRWTNVDLHGVIERLGERVFVGNDSRGAGLAEKLFGRTVEVNDYIYVDSASGVGGIMFLDGAPYRGAGGFAGELGHVKVVPNGRLCQCGGVGCISAYVSEPALARRFSTLGISARTFAEMRRYAEVGTPEALMALDEAGEMLGIALADYINLLNPPAIVLGGGFAILAPFMLPAAERSMARNALSSPRRQCSLLLSDLATEPTPRGGLALALGGLTEATGDGAFPW